MVHVEPASDLSPAEDHLRSCLAAIASVPALNVWTSLREPLELFDELAGGAGTGDLGGITVAVKDNIDVAGVPTTAGCPSFAYVPGSSAPAVQRLVDAGALVIGKTNLDQFATGLVGTRSPFGVVDNPLRPGYVSGGSSSGSAVAVALGHADVGVATDTAGSGRVPAALCGIVGLKGTRGWVPITGVVPACRSFDCTTVFARSVSLAARALLTMADPSPESVVAAVRTVGVPDELLLARCDDEQRRGFARTLQRLEALGVDIVEVDLTAMIGAGRLLYGSALVAERTASVGEFLATGPDDADRVVAEIVACGADYSAVDYIEARTQLDELAVAANEVWSLVDAVVTPTVPRHPSIAEVTRSPIEVNAELGWFVSGCNLVDWCAAVVPLPVSPESLESGPTIGVQIYGRAWTDRSIWEFAARLAGETADLGDEPITEHLLAVVGAHLRGMGLNGQLTDLDARLVESTTTASAYRMYLLDGETPKPGLVRVDTDGRAFEVEVWSLTAAAFGRFVDAVPAPLSIGKVELCDGTEVSGFLCEAVAVQDAPDISASGGWRNWMAG